MSSVSETIVREFFELRGFFVRQQRKYVGKAEDEIDFLVINPHAGREGGLPFELTSADIARIGRAIVVVKGWHTETFTSGMLAGTPELFRFVEPASLREAGRAFGEEATLAKILVVPALPTAAEGREQSIALLRSRGIDAVIPFRVILAALVDAVEVNRNYQKSDLLQTLRILKNYGLLKEAQLELFKAKRGKSRGESGGSGAV